MKKAFLNVLLLVVAFSSFPAFSQEQDAENSALGSDYIPINIGVFGHRQYPFGDYGDFVYFEEGLGLMGEYTLPFTLADRTVGVTAHFWGGKILSCNGGLEHGELFSLYGGAWMDFPLKHGISFRPEIELGFSSRDETIKDKEESYTDALFQIIAAFRWNPYSLFADDLSFDLAPYFSVVPFEDNTTVFFGIRLGIVYNLGKTIHTIQTRRSERGVQEIRDSLKNLNISDVTVQRKNGGITLIMDNIQFAPNSAELIDSEKSKIDALKPLLDQHTNRLLITGYCADDGSSENNMHISASRAGAVADYLIQKNIRNEGTILVVGRGSLDSVDDNKTDAGRARNRRVEITLLEK